jgi:hypothetical protein
VDDIDLRVRNRTYGAFADLGRAPTPEEVGGLAGLEIDEVRASWRRLRDQHALVLDPSADDRIWMANPFSGVPTPYRVRADDRWWFANCAWDSFGICAALHVDGRIETVCSDCEEPLTIEVRDGQPDREDLVFHCLVPARHWWEDIGVT